MAATVHALTRRPTGFDLNRFAKVFADKRDAKADFLANLPEDAVSIIFAEEHDNQTDLMSDYFAHRIVRRVAIGYTTSKRTSFRAMRKAAANFPATAHLLDASKEAEHRENYSMGGGYYLKDGGRHHDGWAVRMTPVEWFSVDEHTENAIEFCQH